MTASDQAEIDAVIAFWLEAGPKAWFTRSDDFDAAIRARFADLHEEALSGDHDDWAEEARGALALILVLDQFSRNLYREDARAYGADPHARRIARVSVRKGHDAEIAAAGDPSLQSFFYMPFMHSEDLANQDYCVALFKTLDDAEGLKYAELHRDIIQKYGRFPHRNKAFGRGMTAAEQAYLDDGGFSG